MPIKSNFVRIQRLISNPISGFHVQFIVEIATCYRYLNSFDSALNQFQHVPQTLFNRTTKVITKNKNVMKFHKWNKFWAYKLFYLFLLQASVGWCTHSTNVEHLKSAIFSANFLILVLILNLLSMDWICKIKNNLFFLWYELASTLPTFLTVSFFFCY